MSLSNLLNSFRNLALGASNVAKSNLMSEAIAVRKPLNVYNGLFLQTIRFVGKDNPYKYKRGLHRPSLRRMIIKPEKYTVTPLWFQRLGGRDPETGRVVCSKIGGGIKHKYRWVLFTRQVPKGSPPLVEKVDQILDDPLRTAKIALVMSGDQKRYLLATVNMKPGDLIKSSSEIPRMPVRPSEGDAWPLGALPVGTVVHNVETLPGNGGYFARAAGTCCQILRKIPGRVIVQIPSKREVSLSEECMATVGRVSNTDHNKIPIGSAQANRWLGNRPCSGLWHRKDGYCGRKIRAIPPMKVYDGKKPKLPPVYKLSI